MSGNPVNNFSKNLRKILGLKKPANNSLKSFEFISLAVLITSMLLFAYANHFNNPFHFDDEHTIVSNQSIRDIRNIPRFFKDATTTSSLPANQSYRPGLTALNAIDYWIGGTEPPKTFYFHVSIFISYLLLGFFLFLMTYKIFNVATEHSWNKYFALFATGFFMLHTANAETINYIVQRADSFSTLMVVIAFVIYLYKPQWRKLYVCLVPIIIGFFVKEPVLMFVPLLFLYILFFEKKMSVAESLGSGKHKTLQAFFYILPLLGAGVLLFYLSQSLTSPTWNPGGGSWWPYLKTQTFVVVHYFNNFLLPVKLSADTDWTIIYSIFDDRVLTGSAFILGMCILVYFTSKTQIMRPIAFGILWFFIALLPTSSIFPLSEVLNDHRTFFPYIGLCIALTWAIAIFIIKFQQTIFSSGTLSIMCLVLPLFILTAHTLGVRTRNKVWSSGESLWYDVTVKSPNNARGLMNYGNVLMAQAKWDEALNYFNRAKQIWPQYAYIYINIGVLYGATNHPAEAENNFKYALQLNPMMAGSYFYYARWLKGQGRVQEAKKLIVDGLKVAPNSIELINAKKEFEQQPGNPVSLDQAIINASQDPTPENYLALSLALYNAGKFEKCIEAAEEALKLKPDYDLAYNNICAAYNVLKNWDKAIEAGEKGLKLNPGNKQLMANLAEAKMGKAGQ